MRIPLSWISLYTPLSDILKNHNIRNIAHTYSTHTAEIDGIDEYTLDKVVVGKVVSCEKHPESKKLSIVRVNQGPYGEETILTWAPNIVDAKYVAVALVGAVLPGDFTISERPMAGMISRGMICGADEIGLAKESDGGIMILEQIWSEELLETMLGTSVFDLRLDFPWRSGEISSYRIGDPVFEIDNKFITNRPDLFSVLGNAREFHAVYDIPTMIARDEQKNRIHTSLEMMKPLKKLATSIETKHCLSYHLLEMKNIEVHKSPLGIKLMMERADLSVKMDLVDITNLIMTELGQPMHVFDADAIKGNISVRQAKVWETLLALNGNTYELTTDDMVIADESGPVAIAWVIGGMESAVSETTKNIIWESACFDATAVRLTAQRHWLRTDASTRYEKSLDPTLALSTFCRVREYLEFLGKSYEPTGASVSLDESRVQSIHIHVDYEFINMKAGVEIPKERVVSLLENLGFAVSPKWTWIEVEVPSWRASKDINIQEDIAEEVARIYGYDRTPLTPLWGGFSIAKKNSDRKLRSMILTHFAERNWNEVYTYSFTNEKLESQILSPSLDSAIKVVNAFNEEYTHMRTSLAPRLFLGAGENLKYAKQFWFFEIGKVYKKDSTNTDVLLKNINKKPLYEGKKIAGVALAHSLEEIRKHIEWLLLKTISYIPPVHTGARLSFLHPGASGSYREDDVIIAEFGKVHPAVSESFGLGEAYYFEIDFETLLSHMENSEQRFQPISRFQTIPRELNFVMDTHTPTGDVARTLDALHPWITDVTVDSIFEDVEKVGAGKKSVNFAFTLTSHESTISDDDALSVQNLIILEMEKKGYLLRK